MDSWLQMNTSDPRIYAEGIVSNAKALVGLNSVLMIFIIIANAVFLITLIRSNFLHTASNILLGAISLTDLLVGLILEPIWIAQLVRLIQRRFSSRLFAIQALLINTFIGLSFVYMTMISCDRYFAICHPFKYLRYATNKLALKTSSIAFLLLLGVSPISIFNTDNLLHTVIYIKSAIGSIIGFLLIIISNCRIYLVVMKQRRQVIAITNWIETGDESIVNRERERKRANVVIIIVVAFLICYLPSVVFYHYGAVDDLLQLNSERLTVFMWAYFLICLNSLANPLLYCYRLQSIRRAMIATMQHMKRSF